MIMMNHDMAYGDTGAFRVIPPQVSPKVKIFLSEGRGVKGISGVGRLIYDRIPLATIIIHLFHIHSLH